MMVQSLKERIPKNEKPKRWKRNGKIKRVVKKILTKPIKTQNIWFKATIKIC